MCLLGRTHVGDKKLYLKCCLDLFLGVCPPASADETFEHHLQRLRKLIKKRSELYEAEERALRVMLEGEQEEERKREFEKKQRKEKEKILLQKREIESKLFGDPRKFFCNQWRKGRC